MGDLIVEQVASFGAYVPLLYFEDKSFCDTKLSNEDRMGLTWGVGFGNEGLSGNGLPRIQSLGFQD